MLIYAGILREPHYGNKCVANMRCKHIIIVATLPALGDRISTLTDTSRCSLFTNLRFKNLGLPNKH